MTKNKYLRENKGGQLAYGAMYLKYKLVHIEKAPIGDIKRGDHRETMKRERVEL